MPGYCAVPLCKSRKGSSPGISFHEFPSDEDRRRQWLKNVSREGAEKGSTYQPNCWDVICSKHFKDTDYVTGLKIKKLTRTAVPTVFERYPKYLVTNPKPPRRELKRVASKVSASVQAKIQRLDVGPSTFDATEQTAESMCAIPETENEIVVLPSTSTSVTTQTRAEFITNIGNLRRKVKLLQRTVNRQRREIDNLRDKVASLEDKIANIYKSKFYTALKIVELESEENDDARSHFLLGQLLNFPKSNPRYSEETVRQCVAWRIKSPKGYEHARRNNILQLPSRTTLNRYIGNSASEVGISQLVKQRFESEIKTLKAEERFGSIIIDEMAINEKLIYDREQDRCFGLVQMNKDEEDSRIANKLLCFLLRGLTTRYTIPVAYFFTRSVTGKQLYDMSIDVIKCVEEYGFSVIRIVTDNFPANTAMFRRFGNGKLKSEIFHPLDQSRRLFLSFDPCHILKNLWVQFLNREMGNGGEVISSKYVQKIFDIQKGLLFKPVRFLTRMHINPTNFEKMRVLLAVQIFSPPMTATIKFFRDNPISHTEAPFFKESTETVKLMEEFYKWFRIHNCGNKTYYITARDRNIMHFFELSDERLEWLEFTFIPYMEDLMFNSKVQNMSYLTNETHEALIHTTRSTVACIRYLLQQGFAFVLTKSFNSDPIERFFGVLRQECGGNDVVDARAAAFAIDNILKSGIARSRSDKSQNKKSQRNLVNCEEFPDSVTQILDSLLTIDNLVCSPAATIQNATLTLVAGYLARTVENKVECQSCQILLSTPRTSSPLFALIMNQDRGGLIYPSPHFVAALDVLKKFCETAVDYMILSKPGILKRLKAFVLPKMERCDVFKCARYSESENHNKLLCSIVIEKFMRPLLFNFTKLINADVKKTKVQNKPLSRKVLKV